MRKNNNEKKKMIIWICLLFALVLGIGYAVLTEKLSVDGTVEYGAMAWDVGFSSVTDGGGTITSTPTLSNDKKSITVSCNIGVSSKSETCIVKAKIKNADLLDTPFVDETDNEANTETPEKPEDNAGKNGCKGNVYAPYTAIVLLGATIILSRRKRGECNE